MSDDQDIKRTAGEDGGETTASGAETTILTGGPGEEVASTGPAMLAPGELESLREKAAKSDEHWRHLVQLSADFDNFRKRVTRERQEAQKYANEGLLTKLLPALDNFEAALAAMESHQGPEVQSLRTGISMVHSLIKSVLAEAGLEEVPALEQPFDPKLHEAVSSQETDRVPEGQVVQQLRRGYRLKDRLLRPASVVVAKKAGT